MKGFGSNDGFRQKLILYLDGAMSREESRAFLTEVRNSPEYLKMLQKEQSFREFLKKKISRRPVSPALVDSIKSKLNISRSSS